MAKLLPGKEKIFLSPDGSSKVVSLLARDAVCLFLLMSSGTCMTGFPGGASGLKKKKKKNPPVHAGDIRDAGLIPGLGRSAGVVSGNLLQYSCLENPMDRGASQATALRVSKESDRTEVTYRASMYLQGSSPFWSPDFILRRFPFIDFHNLSLCTYWKKRKNSAVKGLLIVMFQRIIHS